MEFGLGYFPTHQAMGPGAIAAFVEERGQQALFFAEHTHIPAVRATDHPSGVPISHKYWHTYDLFVALAMAAAATSRLRLGTGICLVVERDPIITAKEVASIDHLSGGRMEFGVGAGWNREEMANHGTDPRKRMAVMRERVEAMKVIWHDAEATYHGEYVNFDQIWCWPKPAQRPHRPVLFGGMGPTVLERVLAHGDGWIPGYREFSADRVAELRARAERTMDIQVFGVPADPAVIAELEELGVNRALYSLPSAGRPGVEAALELWERAIAQAHGES